MCFLPYFQNVISSVDLYCFHCHQDPFVHKIKMSVCLSLDAGDVTFSFVSHEREPNMMAMAKLCFVEHFTLTCDCRDGGTSLL